MESQFRKWVNLSYLAVAFLLAYLVFSFGTTVIATWDLEARVRDVDLILRGVSVVAGAILFIALYRNDHSNQFMNEVMVELSRVTWPATKDTTNATVVVIVMVLVSGMILGVLDFFWTQLLKEIL